MHSYEYIYIHICICSNLLCNTLPWSFTLSRWNFVSVGPGVGSLWRASNGASQPRKGGVEEKWNIWNWLKLKMINNRCMVCYLFLMICINTEFCFPYPPQRWQPRDGGLKPPPRSGFEYEKPMIVLDFHLPGGADFDWRQILRTCEFCLFVFHVKTQEDYFFWCHSYVNICIYIWCTYNFCWCHICHTPFPGVGALPSEDIHCDFGVDWFDLKASISMCRVNLTWAWDQNWCGFTGWFKKMRNSSVLYGCFMVFPKIGVPPNHPF